MKNLDIVNREIEYYKERIEEHKKYYKDYPDIFDKETYEFNIFCLNEQEQIKKDLEILEIIINKKVDVYYLHILLKIGQLDVVLNRYNLYARDRALTMLELLKIKELVVLMCL